MRYFFSFLEDIRHRRIRRNLPKMNKYFFECCDRGDLATVKRLIEQSKISPNEKSDEYGLTPLEFVSRYDKLEIVKYLVEEVKVNTKTSDEQEFSPLHHASLRSDIETVKYLVEEAGLNPEIRDKYGNTPLHLASQNGQIETVKYLVGEEKVDTEIKNINGNTPLHGASRYGCVHLEIVKYFIQHDVDTSIKNNYGKTFLDMLGGEQKDEIEKMIEDLKWRKSNTKSRRF